MWAVMGFFFFSFCILSSFFIIFPGEEKEEKKATVMDSPSETGRKGRTFEKRDPPPTNYALIVNSTKCQGIPGK